MCKLDFVKNICFVFCDSGSALAAANICLCAEQLEGGHSRDSALLHNKVVNLRTKAVKRGRLTLKLMLFYNRISSGDLIEKNLLRNYRIVRKGT